MASSGEVDYFSANCREELDEHVSCVKIFLAEHVKFGTPYAPGSGDSTDRCSTTRNLYMRCMKSRREHPITPQQAIAALQYNEGPPPCEMELSLHGNCVARQLERCEKLGEKYMTQGGEDRCSITRTQYEKCIRQVREGKTDKWGGYGEQLSTQMGKNMSHLIT
ncbi:hypothetical protein IE077_002783 [Cardiosporidium cionae]|uniref:IMS import disulfide relay-system CHCH-CHCH-like Cx9C domain-containing protein n=1 Tax=Cardiosporidium cionae TaxID=476202 RepID=A0ABQ7JFD4_9APIC|nr:hypothetical protein IE077_002783 [Cardiosporidium cionae]|eukprot:KAF8822737.1 hypothetical protein IE077_002783 [Cardiosporidium cionae]